MRKTTSELKQQFANKKIPRGIRNNNMGNLRISPERWNGKIPVAENTDGSFEQFVDHFSGLRAMATDLANDFAIDRKDTLRKLVTEYAPPSENKTSQYIASVAKMVGITADQKLTMTSKQLAQIIEAKIIVENGEADVKKHVPDYKTLVAGAVSAINSATKSRLKW